MAYPGSPDERRMSAIAEQMMRVVELVGAQSIPLSNFENSQDILNCLHQIGNNATILSNEAKTANNEFTDWRQLETFHPSVLTSNHFNQQYVNKILISGAFSEETINEISEGAGWFAEQHREVANSVKAESNERMKGWINMISRSNWWMAFLAFCATVVWALNRQWPNLFDGTELPVIYSSLGTIFCLFGYLSLRPYAVRSWGAEESPEKIPRKKRRIATVLSEERVNAEENREHIMKIAKRDSLVFKFGFVGFLMWLTLLIGCTL